MRARYALYRQPKQQAGVVLLIALIALIAMTLAAISLTRSVETNNAVLGNLAFKSDTLNGAELAIEEASKILQAMTEENRSLDDTANGYYSALIDPDFTGEKTSGDQTDDVDWDGTCSSCTTEARRTDSNGAALTVNGMPAAFVIARSCSQPNLTVSDPNQTCLSTTVSVTGQSHATGSTGGGYQIPSTSTTPQPYYRVLVRVNGPRNTYSYVEAVLL